MRSYNMWHPTIVLLLVIPVAAHGQQVSTVDTVDVLPQTLTLAATAVVQMRASPRDQAGAVQPVAVTWASSNESVATVSSSGQLTAIAAGTATITAAFGTITGTATITVVPAQLSDAQAGRIAEAVQNRLSESKILKVGLSVGYRYLVEERDKLFRDVAIVNDTLRVDKQDRSDLVLSGVVTAFPFHRAATAWRRLGFMLNINLADFAGEAIGVFNRSIEGGMGIAIQAHDEFAFGVTVERVFSRGLRSGVKPDQPLLGDDGQPLKSVDVDDGRFFKNDNLTAVSLKFIFYF